MTNSKAWNWSLSTDTYWDTPCTDYYYISKRWEALGFKHVLDLGCGKGRHSLAFETDGFKVSACDLSPLAIDVLNENKKNLDISTLVCDILELPYADNSFDCLFAFHVISHTDSVGIIQILKEIKRVIKLKGEIFIDFISKESLMFASNIHPKIDDNSVLMSTKGAEFGIPHFFIDFNDIEKLLNGFKILNVEKKQTYKLNYTDEAYGTHFYVHAEKI